ncbi:MAG: DUF433 domain-containing protein [Gammaproteobacteria bacterium]|nr:DUF433 domain-containing protein [Gammaproteobacteria bacterium]
MTDFSKRDILEILTTPTYSLITSARLVNMKKWTVRRYLRGYEYDYDQKRIKQPPVIKGSNIQEPYASFLDLIDLIFVRELLKRGFFLPTIRKALDEARQWLGTKHFGRSEFFTCGASEIALRLPKDGSMITLLTGGQSIFPQVIEQFSDKLDFEDITQYGFAKRWYPRGMDGMIVIDPEIAFGRPIINGTGIPTSNIYDLYLGEEKNIQPVCNWFNISIFQVQTAVQFEHSLCA